MGAEDYQVVAEFDGDNRKHVENVIQKLGFLVEPAPYEGAKSDYFVYEDANCFIESELSACNLSLRFAVCQPDDADSALSRIIWQLKNSVTNFSFVDAEADPEMGQFQSAEELSCWIRDNAGEKRRFWFGDFGGDERKCRCCDAFG